MDTDNKVEAQPAEMSGQAAVIRAKKAIFTATVHVTRKDTGRIDTYEVVGTAEDQPKEPE